MKPMHVWHGFYLVGAIDSSIQTKMKDQASFRQMLREELHVEMSVL